ncbi:MAG: NAD(P)/FAD-dependent oxidoreductase [Pseudonocardiaceae bacterium]
MPHVAVVGASLAGVRVAEALRNKGFGGRLSLIGDEPHLPYDRPPLSKSVLTAGGGAAELGFHDRAWFEENGIDLRLGERAVRLDPNAGVLETDTGTVRFDDVIVATGAGARNPFIDAPAGVFTLRTVDDAARLRTALDTAAHLVVVGGGFIGLEVAASARALGKEVTVVEVAEIPLSRNLGPAAASVLGDLARANGVRLICGRSVAELRGGTSIEQIVLDNGDVFDCDAVVVGVGAVPNTSWLDGSGLEITRAGLICDETGRAGRNVWAAGDVCTWTDSAGVPRRHEHWTSAAEQAKVVAHNLVEADKRTVETATYVWSDQFGKRINIVGNTTDHDAVRFLARDPDGLAALYSRDGVLVGACVIGQARLMLKCRKWVAQRTATAEIPEWDVATV